MPAPMQRHRKTPRKVPNQTFENVSSHYPRERAIRLQGTCLPDEHFVRCSIFLWTQGLSEKGQQNGDNDARFQGLSEADEED